ncbi:Pyridine nucleotide-disulfide oxidoreductase domain containing protein [Amanita muscaria]
MLQPANGLVRTSCSSLISGTRPSARQFSLSSPRFKQRLIILGSGWGGYEVLRGIDKKKWDVTVISPVTYFNFTPLLASTAVGTLEFRCAVEPVRRYTPQVTFYQAWCDEIDFANKILKCMPATKPIVAQAASAVAAEKAAESQHPQPQANATPFTLRYDKLVVAVGAYSQSKLLSRQYLPPFNVPGIKKHAHFLKDVREARMIRSRILECFEQASQPTVSDIDRRNVLNFCIVGGGPTGVEFAAELYDLIHTDVSAHYPNLAKLAKITIYDVASSILGSFDESLIKYTEKKFSREGINILTRRHVERLEHVLPFGLLVWSTGLAPNPLISAIEDVKKDEKSQRGLITNENMNIIMSDGKVNPDVWAIGDASRIQGWELPATAQVANQEAKYVFRKLNKIARDQESAEPFSFKNHGSLAYVGDWKAIYDGPAPEKAFMSKEAGRVAWLLWRSAYFTGTLSIRNKILVPMYW